MLMQELVEKISPLFDGNNEGEIFSNDFRPAIELISNLSSAWENVIEKVAGIAAGDSGNFSPISVNIYSMISRTHASISGVSSRKFFESYEKLILHLKSLSELDAGSVSIEVLVSDLEDFTELYDQFLSDPVPARAYALLKQANGSWVQLVAIGGILFSICRKIQSSFEDEIVSSNESSMSIFLSSTDNYSVFLLRLTAVGRLYSVVCRLLNVAEEDFPLKIIKIESGSLWIKVFGESRVLGLVERYIDEAASYIYRNFTTEGRISAVPRNVQALDQVLGLRSSLRDQGLDTENMDHEISNASIHIAKSLNLLLEKQGSVRINGKKLTVGSERLRKELESKPWSLLEQAGVDVLNEDDSERIIKD